MPNPATLMPPSWERKAFTRPDMILQFAKFLGQKYAHYSSPHDIYPAEVYAAVNCSLNGRPFQMLTDPTIDLVSPTASKWPFNWVTELNPLPKELESQYPWKWEWNFNWVRGIDNIWNKDEHRYSMSGRYYEGKHNLQRHCQDFADLILQKHNFYITHIEGTPFRRDLNNRKVEGQSEENTLLEKAIEQYNQQKINKQINTK
eukprot:CAMPEP_0174278458 /NCGR_PEP_ID=MMETSP0439-20130205/61492_1 /TAXON_ID=0 /ORGANISM="Stereomyxa ramosa, Strain Chinc5" /LENGTH=201 /DNA_ID=CAMNT_0015370877 /DNA_START=1280 /DNA_END=1885 /DNA_ORIENTATION=-